MAEKEEKKHAKVYCVFFAMGAIILLTGIAHSLNYLLINLNELFIGTGQFITESIYLIELIHVFFMVLVITVFVYEPIFIETRESIKIIKKIIKKL